MTKLRCFHVRTDLFRKLQIIRAAGTAICNAFRSKKRGLKILGLVQKWVIREAQKRPIVN
jgi:hypothetical protein